jgi:hypothetical protein
MIFNQACRWWSVYFIESGNIFCPAEVILNNKYIRKRLNTPYSQEIINYLKKGENTFEIRVTPIQFNGFSGEYLAGKEAYRAFKRMENNPM